MLTRYPRYPGLNGVELATILAALRFMQKPENYDAAIEEFDSWGFFGDDGISLSREGIDRLCERLNCGWIEPRRKSHG